MGRKVLLLINARRGRHGEARGIKEIGGNRGSRKKKEVRKNPPLRSFLRIIPFFWGKEGKNEVGRAYIENLH